MHRLGICLIGGLGAAAHIGRLYREHEDLDFAVTRDFFDRYIANAHIMRQVDESIYITSFDGSRVLPTNRSRRKSSPTIPKRVRVDFFVYTQNGFPYAFGGAKGHLKFGESYPLRLTERSLLDIPLIVAPRYLITDLKRVDYRPKGRLDYEMLTGRR